MIELNSLRVSPNLSLRTMKLNDSANLSSFSALVSLSSIASLVSESLNKSLFLSSSNDGGIKKIDRLSIFEFSI